ncbi:MAG: GTPase HflX [Clostridia bacterium]|nr:GTPase HflX [Clostridia bacterium]
MEDIKNIEKVYVIEPILEGSLGVDYLKNEIFSLIKSADACPVGFNAVKLREITPATFIGKGKVEEIRLEVESLEADTVVFDGALSPSQTLNLREAIGVNVIDRTTLILDIFARSATTHEGKLQVELAQNKYLYPRLKGKGQALSRLGGGIGTRGPGETQLETDRRHIKERIHKLESELKELETRRNLQTSRRTKNEEFVISLVGYTNVGKSTLLNLLTGSQVLVKNQLFATLDPTVRKAKINGINVLITDTVGFIRDIPHDLVNAFKSTLESATSADLIIIVCDATEDYNEQLKVTTSTLEGLNATSETLTVLNKCDALENLLEVPNDYILISAKDGKNINALLSAIEKVLYKYYVKKTYSLSYSELKDFTPLTKYLDDFEFEYLDSVVLCKATLKKIHLDKFSNFKAK